MSMKIPVQAAELLDARTTKRALACGVSTMGMVVTNAVTLDVGMASNSVVYYPDVDVAWAVLTSFGWVVLGDLQVTSSDKQDSSALAEWSDAVEWAKHARGKDANAILLMNQTVDDLKSFMPGMSESARAYNMHIITRIYLTAVWLWKKAAKK